MEPRIQYAKTSDGVNIAYWALGKGAPFVHMPWFRASHVQLEWQIPEYREWYEALARNRQLVRYDARGVGMSDRDVSDYSLDALVSDLEAVVDRLDLEKFALFGLLHGGPVAIAYAARHPERVSHLLLWCTYARNADYEQSTEIQATRAFMDKDWALYTETLAHVRLGWSEGPSARQFAKLIRESMTPQVLRATQEAYHDLNVSHLLPQIKAPTLVMHRSRLSWFPLEVARGLASAIPNAGLAVLEGASGAPFLDDADAVLSAIDRFLGLRARPRKGAPARRKTSRSKEPTVNAGRKGPAVQTILFSDIEGSTALTERLGDAKARDVIRRHERIIRGALKAHGGSEVKATGDGFMASFGSATKAVECAVAIQRNMELGTGNTDGLRVRIGLNAGEPIAEQDPGGRGDLFGTAVIVAARIAAQATGGEILVSDVVRQLVAGKGFVFADRGEFVAKGFEEPVRVYEVSWRGGK